MASSRSPECSTTPTSGWAVPSTISTASGSSTEPATAATALARPQAYGVRPARTAAPA
ncbi:hypothetical protein [Streptomyces coeruleorubidus]|uniref:hypothetical protein n=1 Tax=Streptomyces coeruleorubidus TaxID=116188 RepID=UPI0033BF8F44